MKYLCVTLGLVFCASEVVADTNDTSVVADYMPYLKGLPWPTVPLIEYVRTDSNIWVHPSAPQTYPTVQEVVEDGADFATLIIRHPDGTTYRTYNALVLGAYLCAVYSGDFNRDGLPDFLAVKPGTGSGLAAARRVGVFAFSQKDRYRFTRTWTMGLAEENLIEEPQTKEFRFIHTSYRLATAADGKYHNFLIHRFFKWDGSKFVEDANWPAVWIPYPEGPKHMNTKLLTAREKAKAWAEDLECSWNIEW